MKKMLIVLILMISVLMISCNKLPSSPSDPTTSTKAYTLQFKYTRVEVRDASRLNQGLVVCFGLDTSERYNEMLLTESLARIDDYDFAGQFSQKYSAGAYCILACDAARYDGVDNGTMVVGYKFVITVVETGFTKELTRIMYRTIWGSAIASNASTLARFFLQDDGTFIDY